MLIETLTYLYRVVTRGLEATVEVTLAQVATEGTADLATSLDQVGVSQCSITLRAAQC